MEQILWKPIHADYVCFPDCHDHISLRQKRSGQSLKGTSSLLLQGKKTSKLKRQLDHKKKFCIVKNYNFTLTPFQMFWACVLDSEPYRAVFLLVVSFKSAAPSAVIIQELPVKLRDVNEILPNYHCG